jgi:hypothetical protein
MPSRLLHILATSDIFYVALCSVPLTALGHCQRWCLSSPKYADFRRNASMRIMPMQAVAGKHADAECTP